MLGSEDKSLTLQLVRNTGYQLEQDNGQRKYGPPPEWNGSPPRKTEVFVGSLPRDIYEYELVPFFERVGRIYMLRTMLSFSGYNRGYAFVKYCQPEDAERAIRELNNAEIRPGQRIGVVRSLDNCRLYIGNLPTDRSREEIRNEISCLTEDVVDVIVHEDRQTGTLNRGFAFVEYATHKAAAKARRKLLPAHISLWDRVLSIDWATPEPELDQDNNQSVTNLYCRNLKLEVTEERLHEFFSFNGLLNLSKVKKIKNYAFLNYQTRDDAQKALHYLKSMDTKEFSAENCNLDITWAKPSNTNRLKHSPPRTVCHMSDHSPSKMLAPQISLKKDHSWNSSFICKKDLSSIYANNHPPSPIIAKRDPFFGMSQVTFPASHWTSNAPTYFAQLWPDNSFYAGLSKLPLASGSNSLDKLYEQLGLSSSLVDYVN